MRDSVLKWIAESKLNKSGQYLYSDLGFYLLQMAIEKITKTTLDKYFEKHFAEPMQLPHITFKPKEKKTYLRTVPTEYDYIFRQQQINGTVHDPGAAMLGGVAGNAGLFSNAVSLATLFQPFFYQGYYRNPKYFKPSTIELFCKAQNKNNRRGLGFDKPELNLEKSTPCSKYASPASFGHSGFTGTFIWIDPTYDLVYVFLSNRVNPDASNNKLVKWNVRTAIQDEIYKILLEK
jgi:CubicO group peptidase (beta-lactamase class C family)